MGFVGAFFCFGGGFEFDGFGFLCWWIFSAGVLIRFLSGFLWWGFGFGFFQDIVAVSSSFSRSLNSWLRGRSFLFLVRTHRL